MGRAPDIHFMTSLNLTLLLVLICKLSACSEGLLLDKNKCQEGKVQRGSMCVDQTTTTPTIANCVDVDLSKVVAGEKATMCDGSTGVGTFVGGTNKCASDGQVDCVTSSLYKAADISKITPDKISLGTSIAGIVGTKRDSKQCRNTAQLSVADSASPPSNYASDGNGGTFVPAHVNTGTDEIATINHNFKADTQLRFSSTTTLPAPLVSGTTYYAIIISTTIIKVAATPSGAAIDITTTGVGTHRMIPVPDGVASYWDTIEDYNNGLSSNPANNPWSSSDYICDSSNFTNVSGAAGLVPSNTIPTGATAAFTQIWQDNLTGMYFSNPIYSGAMATKTWADAIVMCESLNGGTAGNGWRLPTQKELIQLYIDGVAKVPVSGSTLDHYFWSSTTRSDSSSKAYWVAPSAGQVLNWMTRYDNSYSVLCMR